MPQGRTGRQAPVVYAALARACVPAIKAANPRAQVAIGPVASLGAWHGLSPLRFLERYLAAGGPAPDVLAVNPYMEGQTPQYLPTDYPSDGAVTVNNLDVLEQKLRGLEGHEVPVWLTELAWRTAAGTPGAVTPASRRASSTTPSTSFVSMSPTSRCSSGSWCETSRPRATGSRGW